MRRDKQVAEKDAKQVKFATEDQFSLDRPSITSVTRHDNKLLLC